MSNKDRPHRSFLMFTYLMALSMLAITTHIIHSGSSLTLLQCLRSVGGFHSTLYISGVTIKK